MMLTWACSAILLYAALKGGNSLKLVSSPPYLPARIEYLTYSTDHFPFSMWAS
jgi:hypothetical protein